MSIEPNHIHDELRVWMQRAHEMANDLGMKGFGVAQLVSSGGILIATVPFANLITNAGDNYYALKAAAAIGTPNASPPTAMNGMKLGTGATAAGKSATGAASIESATYISASNVTFASSDATYPQVSAVGTNVGYYVTYKGVWPGSGGLANANINEVAIVNDAGTNAYSTVANTLSRAVLSSTVNKGTNDILTITWQHKFLGA